MFYKLLMHSKVIQLSIIYLSIIYIPYLSIYLCTYLYSFFFGLHQWHMEVPRPGVESGLQLPAYPSATAMSDLSCICNLQHSSWQCQILNPLSEARD